MDRRLAEMAETSDLIVGTEGLNQILQSLAIRAREVTSADFAALSTFDEAGSMERFIYDGIDEATARRLGPPPRGRGLLGAIVTESEALRVGDVRSHPDYSGWPDGHPEMGAFLGVPIRAGGRTIGSIYVTRAPGKEGFSDQEEVTASFLALQAASLIWSARAREQENRVVLLEERASIAADLHDGTIQSLYALGLELDAHLRRPGLPESTEALLGTSIARINQLIADIRQYITMLEASGTPAAPDLARDLSFALRELVPNGVDTVLNIAAAALQGVDRRTAEELLYIAREAISNAVRHADPTKIAVDFRQDGEGLALTVQDNGTGFDMARARVGLGTVSMRTRAARLGADLSVIGVPGMGTMVRVEIPRSNDDEPD